MNKLNIAMFSDSFYPIVGGREYVINNLMSCFSKTQNCFLAAPKIKINGKSFADHTLPYEVIRCNSIKLTKTEFISIANKSFRKKIEKKQIDIIHCQTKYALTNYAIKLRARHNIPVVTTVHTNYLEEYKQRLKIPFLYNFLIKRVVKTLNKMDMVYTVSETMKTNLRKIGFNNDVVVIPNGSDFTYPENSEQLISDANKLFGLGGVDKVLLFVGRITNTKNVGFLLKSLQIVKEKYFNNFKILFVGSGQITKFHEIATELGLSQNVVFLDQITDRKLLQSLYLRSDLLACPSINETFGMVVSEAGICKTPSIVIKNVATSERIIDGVNGFISDNDINCFASKIFEAFSDKEKLLQCGVEANKIFSLSWDEIAKIQLTEYEKVISTYKSKI